MKLRSKKSYESVNISLKKDTKNKANAINERREEVKKRAEKKRSQITDRKEKKLIVVLERIKPGDVTVHQTTIEEIRKTIKGKKSRKTVEMSDHVKPVEALELTGNLSENWRRFKRNYEIFEVATGVSTKEEPIKISTFLNAVGPETVDIFDTLGLTALQKQSYTEVTKALETFCRARKNTVYERYLFYKRDQKDGESFDSFLMDLKKLVRSCEFGEATDEMMRDRIVMGITDKSLQTKLLETANLTYDMAIEKGRAAEATRQQQQTMNRMTEIHEVKTDHVAYASGSKNNKGNNNNKKQNEKRGQPSQNYEKNTQHRPNDTHNRNENHNRNVNRNAYNRNNNNGSQNNYNNQSKCKRCNYAHGFRDNCPAYGKTCNNCSKSNHFSSVCRSKSINSIAFNDNDDEFYIGAVESQITGEPDDVIGTRWLERIRINNQIVAFKIDTGAEMNVLPLHVFKRLNLDIELQRTHMTLRAFGGQRIVPVGMCSLLCNYKNMSLRVVFAIVDLDVIPILGLPSSTRFKIVNPPRSKQNANKINRYNL